MKPLRAPLEALVDHGLTVRFDELPDAVVASAKARLSDVVGCALGGARADGCAGLLDMMVGQGGAPEARVIGTEYRLPAINAAMVNAIFARSFDFEVMTVRYHDELIPSHHSATTTSVALAAADIVGASGQDMLTALIVGDDLAARLLIASGLDFGQGWDGSSVYSVSGAVLAAARLYGLDRPQTIHAIGLAVAQISHTIQDLYDGSPGFKLSQGTAARNALTAVELAKHGWAGMTDPLGSRFGFFATYTAGCTRPEVLTEDIGRSYFAEEHFKRYPSCMATHHGIEAALAVQAMDGFDAEQVEEVTIRVPERLLGNFCNKPFAPRAFPHCDAIFNFAFPVSVALQTGAVVPENYLGGAEGWAFGKTLTDRTKVGALGDGRRGIEVSAVLSDGRVFTQHNDRLGADPRDGGYDPARAEAKFRMQAEPGHGGDRSGHIFESLARVEMAARVSDLTY
ncbi:MAG: MmgE/PrpD family protein [Pseudomonadota bacterium]|nr:MmgE/PrpD family protein [Pseudomonadota bacterium]